LSEQTVERQTSARLATLGEQAAALDERIALRILDQDRSQIWQSVGNILDSYESGHNTTLALGYVQSGKTTNITALCAAAADRGFRVIVAILGSTLLLRDQNRTRVEDYLGLEENNYRWVSFNELSPKRTPRDIESWLARDRVILIPVLKNPSVIKKVTSILSSVDLQGLKCLVIDDEADQASLNTQANNLGESSTYAAIKNLRSVLPSHLYVQYTATPYAPLLLSPDDHLMPTHVEFLLPGTGYTGGREFFIDHAEKVLRNIPSQDEQNARNQITELPKSLETALANFLVGAVHLYLESKDNAPISMLIHSTFKNDIQEKYKFLLDRFIDGYKNSPDRKIGDFADEIKSEMSRLYSLGIKQISEESFWQTLDYVLRETHLWLVNSATEVKKVQWNLVPFHILIGGNKLDRGFTVEGLTVTYMNRPASDQIDTIEQRARAFGYRTNLLPYCQFFATARTRKTLRGIVHTEDDLRANLRDFIENDRTVADWAHEIGLFLPQGTKPTRDSVMPSLSKFNPDGDWFALRKPFVDESSKKSNVEVLQSIGIFDAPFRDYQRVRYRTVEMSISDLLEKVITTWKLNQSSPGWRHDEIVEYLSRRPDVDSCSYILLMSNPDDPNKPRQRKWVEDTGFVNLFQGADIRQDNPGHDYLGDRKAGLLQYGEDTVVLQIHHVNRRNFDDSNLYTLAIHIGDGKLVKRING
jgi:Z1 domain